MKKLFAVLAMAVITSSAFGQSTLPGRKQTVPDVPNIADFRQEFSFEILQVQQCVAPSADVAELLNDPKDPSGASNNVLPLPSGIVPTNWCLRGNGAGGLVPDLSTPACRFVGGVLCLDPGPNGDFVSLATGCPEGTFPVIQGIKLRKIEPRFPKCPDIYPGIDFTQTGVSGIRTFWALKYTPCNTKFVIDIEYGCVNNTFPRHVVQVRTARYNITVKARAQTLRWVIEALHCQPLGVCEVPCITDEGLFQLLLTQADDIANRANLVAGGSATNPGQAELRNLNDALDRFETTLVRYAFFTTTVFSIDEKGNFMPCAIFAREDTSPGNNAGTIGGGAATFPGFIPGNKTINQFGFGIVDTFEHPCVCKLLSDLVCIKADLIGDDP